MCGVYVCEKTRRSQIKRPKRRRLYKNFLSIKQESRDKNQRRERRIHGSKIYALLKI